MEDKVNETAYKRRTRSYIASKVARKKEEGLLLGHEIATVRESLGLTQEPFASKLNIPRYILSKIENNINVQSDAIDKYIREIIASPAYKVLEGLIFQKSVCVNQIINEMEM